MYYFSKEKRKYVGETTNLRLTFVEKLPTSITFDQFTWYKTTLDYRHGLAKRLRKNYRKEINNV